MGCPTTDKYIGRIATLEIAFLCPIADISGATFLPIGATTTKNFGLTANAASAYADDSGGFDDQLVVNSSFELSVSGQSRSADGVDSNQSALLQYYFDSVAGNEQPIVLVRYTWPDKTLTAFMNTTEFSREDPVDGVSTFSASFVVAPSSVYRPNLSDTP